MNPAPPSPPYEPCGCGGRNYALTPAAAAYDHAQKVACLCGTHAAEVAALAYTIKGKTILLRVMIELRASIRPDMTAADAGLIRRTANAIELQAAPPPMSSILLRPYATADADARATCIHVARTTLRRAGAAADAASAAYDGVMRLSSAARENPLAVARAIARVPANVSAGEGEAGGAGA